jgi:hypothetical protein
MRGGHSLPALVRLRRAGNPIQDEWRLTNAATAVSFEGRRYESAAMEYAPPQSRDGFQQGGRLRIAAEAVILELEEGPIPMGGLRHKYGSASWDGQWKFDGPMLLG